MRLDILALALVCTFALLYLGALVLGLLTAVPFGFLGLIPIAIVLALLATVIYQRVTNVEDNYYDRNIEK